MSENTLVIMQEAPEGFTVAVVKGDDIETIWGGDGGLLEDAITTAKNTANEVSAENKDAWAAFEVSTNSADMDELEKKLLSRESCRDDYWAFDPAQQSIEDIAMYYIDHGTGAGNETVIGTLDEAKARAEEGMSYTQTSVAIYESYADFKNDAEPVAISRWRGVKYDPEVNDEEPCADFGDFGYNAAWE
jgi:hypothetical protein